MPEPFYQDLFLKPRGGEDSQGHPLQPLPRHSMHRSTPSQTDACPVSPAAPFLPNNPLENHSNGAGGPESCVMGMEAGDMFTNLPTRVALTLSQKAGDRW